MLGIIKSTKRLELYVTNQPEASSLGETMMEKPLSKNELDLSQNVDISVDMAKNFSKIHLSKDSLYTQNWDQEKNLGYDERVSEKIAANSERRKLIRKRETRCKFEVTRYSSKKKGAE